jgi:hypothetical protein
MRHWRSRVLGAVVAFGFGRASERGTEAAR